MTDGSLVLHDDDEKAAAIVELFHGSITGTPQILLDRVRTSKRGFK